MKFSRVKVCVALGLAPALAFNSPAAHPALASRTRFPASKIEAVGSRSSISEGAAAAVERMVSVAPLVLCMTNRVTPQRVADILLACGAAPAMVENPDEVPSFAAISGAVYVNTGLHSTQIPALRALADMENKPLCVLDPVGFGATAFRSAEISAAVESIKPVAIKGNANEICGLAGTQGSGRGVDSDAATECALAPALALAKQHGCVVSVSGDSDLVVGEAVEAATGKPCYAVARVGGDVPLMAKITGTGCALGAVVAAFAASAGPAPGDRFLGVVGAHALYTAAAVRAMARPGVVGPGGLSVALVDELYLLASNSGALGEEAAFGAELEVLEYI